MSTPEEPDLPATGDAAVDAAVRPLAELDDTVPVERQVEVLTGVLDALQQRLRAAEA